MYKFLPGFLHHCYYLGPWLYSPGLAVILFLTWFFETVMIVGLELYLFSFFKLTKMVD